MRTSTTHSSSTPTAPSGRCRAASTTPTTTA
nr:MAG TPA: hypothetical protein [Caudoviricetes sp.]